MPDVIPLQKRALLLSPEGISMVCATKSDFPIAAVCFHDAAHVLCEIRYAFHEYLAHQMYYRKVVTPSQVPNAIFFERYYVDDAAFRLYNAGEHVAEAIFFMLELSDDDIRPFKDKSSSRQLTIGRYLCERLPDHSVTLFVKRLVDSKNWGKTIGYRGDCVHKQPPLVWGPGAAYLRKNRWVLSEDGSSAMLNVVDGDKPQLTTQEIYDFVMPAFLDLLFVFEGLVGWYEVEMTKPRGGAWRLAKSRVVS